jgi:hypothetical protein
MNSSAITPKSIFIDWDNESDRGRLGVTATLADFGNFTADLVTFFLEYLDAGYASPYIA